MTATRAIGPVSNLRLIPQTGKTIADEIRQLIANIQAYQFPFEKKANDIATGYRGG